MSLPQNDTSTISSRESNEDLRAEQLTRCSVLTGTGRSAIAVVEIWGERATACIESLFGAASSAPMRQGQIRFGVWSGIERSDGGAAAHPSESVVVVPIDSERYEIHCHGGKAAIGRIVADLADFGVQEVPPMASSGVPQSSIATDDRLILEACEVLSSCTTRKTAAIAMDQVRGALKHWRDDSIRSIGNAAGTATNHSARIAREAIQIAASGRLGTRLAEPFEIVLAGPPNVGKSSLINAIVGYDRSITMDLPGTTRDVLNEETVFEGWPLRLRDTAGLHSTEHAIEREGIQRALAAVRSADLVIQVRQPGVHLSDRAFSRVIDQLDQNVTVLQVLNKHDLEPSNESHEQSKDHASLIKTIATTGEGIPQLLNAISGAIQAELPVPGSPVPINRRQQEWLRRIADLAEEPKKMLKVLGET